MLRSVVHMYLKHWRAANLFVSGAAAFPQNPSGKSTLTAVVGSAARPRGD